MSITKEPTSKMIRVWTKAYRPFILGGDVHTPIATEVESGEPYQLEHGIVVYLVKNPLTGQTHVVESHTGAFVGTSLEQVRDDVATADEKVMKDQLKEAEKLAQKAENMPPERFWKMFK